MGLSLYAGPAQEPITLAMAKLQCRIDGTEEDALLDGLIQTARETVETVTRRALITQTWDYVIDDWPGADYIELPMPPLISVTSVKYKDTAGVEATWGSSNYIVDTKRDIGRVHLAYGVSWPSVSLYPTGGITIRFVCGYGPTGDSVPAKLRQAMLLLVGHYFENREAVTGQTVSVLPMGVNALLWQARVMRFI